MAKSLWTSKSAAKDLGITERTVRRWMIALKIPTDAVLIILNPTEMKQLRAYAAARYTHRCEAHQHRRGPYLPH